MKKAAEAFFYQVFRDGFFHADMHAAATPSSIAPGHIVPVDFGIMGRIDEDTRGYLAELLVAFLRRDYHAVGRGPVPRRLRAVRSVAARCSPRLCRSIGEPIFGKPSHRDLDRPPARPDRCASPSSSRWRCSRSSCRCRRPC